MCRSSPPPPTNPLVASAATQNANVNTGIANTVLGNANTYGPNGQTVFNQIGTEQVKDAQGNFIDVPRYESRTTLSPAQQKIYDQQNTARLGLANLANQQIGQLSGVLGKPVDLSHLPKGGTLPTTGPQFTGLGTGPQFARLTGAGLPIDPNLNLERAASRYAPSGTIDRQVNLRNVGTEFANVGGPQRNVGPQDWSADRQRVEQAWMSRLDPQLKQGEQEKQARLVAQGFQPGTKAYADLMQRHDQQVNDARNQAILMGGQEQSRLAGLDFQEFQLENQAQQQAYAQAIQRGDYAKASIAQNNLAHLQAAQFYNQAQAQAEEQNRARGLFGNQATAANNAARATEAQYGLLAQKQGFDQRGQLTGFNNQAAQLQAQNEWNRIMYGNQNAQLGFGNTTNLAIMQNQFRQNALNEQLAARNQATNETAALLHGGQVSLPGQVNYTGGQVAPVNVGANMFAADALQNQQWQQQQQNTNAMLGGLFGLAGTGVQAGMMFGPTPLAGQPATNWFGMQRV